MCSTPVIGVNATAVAEVDWTYWYADVLKPGEYGLLIRCGPSWVWSGNGDDQDGGGGIGTSQWPNYAIQRDWLSLMRNGDCGGEQDADGFYNGGWWLDRSSVGRFPRDLSTDAEEAAAAEAEAGITEGAEAAVAEGAEAAFAKDKTGGTFYYKSGDQGCYDLYKILPRDKFRRIDCACQMFRLLQKTKNSFRQIMHEFGFDARGDASADDSDSDATLIMRPNLQNLFKQTLRWFDRTMNNQIARLKMLHQDADARLKCLDLFVAPFEMPQADNSTRCRSRGAKDMKTMPKKRKSWICPDCRKDIEKGKWWTCRSRGAKKGKSRSPRRRVSDEDIDPMDELDDIIDPVDD